MSDLKHSGELLDPSVVRVFELESPHALIETIDGSTTPPGRFRNSKLSLAVEESTGKLFVYDGESTNNVVFELGEHGEYFNTISYGLEGRYTFGSQIAIDNGEHSPNGALDPKGRYLFVPAFPTGPGHSFAYGPPAACPPTVESIAVTSVTESEAQLHATIEPCSLATTYRFEYTTQQRYEEEGNSFAGAQVAGASELSAGGTPVGVVANLTGLAPGTAYRFRVVAENEKGSDEAERSFSTYPGAEPGPVCENAALRTEASKLLPDCRVYELVTPPDTNAHPPVGVGRLGTYFATREASPSGDAASFEIEGGSISGFEATGSLAGDPYVSMRTEVGWKTTYAGPTPLESPQILPGSNSPDQGYSFWSTAGGEGSAAVDGETTTYLHYPDGHNALIGRGSLGTDPRAVGTLISEGGGHIVFVSGGSAPAVQLEPAAPPSGTKAIYDRTIDPVSGEEETHVVSLLPGNVTPAAGADALYEGASLDGKGIAFSIGKKLYLRYDDEETYEVGEGVTFAGVTEGGRRIFYLEGGNLFAFAVEGEETIQFTDSGDVTPVNVAADGHVAYFISPSVLAGPNPNGAGPVKGQENLYRSEEGSIAFVGTVTERDVKGEFGGSQTVDGLGLWAAAVGPGEFGTSAPGQLAIDPSRATPDGNVILFESRAPLAGYDPEGHAEVYRYDFAHEELDCLSCNPTQAPAGGEASLETLRQSQFDLQPLGPYAFVPNLRPDGRRAFFQSTEQLVPGDTDGLLDVYEWEAQGVGSCNREGGCVYLISSGHSHHPDFLYSVSESGDDVFFRTSDLLLPSDGDATPSIYDARVGGGFPQAGTSKCQGEECRPTLSPPPGLLTPGLLSGGEVPREPIRCPKGKRKVERNGKVRCVKVRHRHHHRRSHKKGRAGK
ncbi:MAG: fibronectin type III domain-containing protein [Solirubrobacterales bacterium]